VSGVSGARSRKLASRAEAKLQGTAAAAAMLRKAADAALKIAPGRRSIPQMERDLMVSCPWFLCVVCGCGGGCMCMYVCVCVCVAESQTDLCINSIFPS
jgi:hypothetical protein